MAIKDFWIYQKRNVGMPWAFYIVKEFDRRYPEATTIDYTLYHEDIENAAHSVSKIGFECKRVSDIVNDMISTLADTTQQSVTSDDYRQLELEILRIIQA